MIQYFLLVMDSSVNPFQTHTNRLLTKLRTNKMDAISYWNLVAVETMGYDYDRNVTRTPNVPGPLLASRAMAMLHGAMYNALKAANSDNSNSVNNAIAKAAIMEAAYYSLYEFFSTQRPILNAVRADFIRRITINGVTMEMVNIGMGLGRSAATNMFNERANDGSKTQVSYQPSSELGYHQVDPLHPTQGFLSPGWAQVKPFFLRSSSQFRIPTTIGTDVQTRLLYLDSERYLREYDEVKSIGAKVSTVRTADQEEIAIFWAYDGAPRIGLPVRLYNQVARVIATNKSNSLETNARMFALINYAMADAIIACWETKYHYNFWRPIVAIRRGTGKTPADPTWEPLGAPASGIGTDFTPNFPSYSSGHAAFGSSVFQAIRAFYGTDQIGFSFQSDEFNGETIDSRTKTPRPARTRRYTTLSQAETENTLARIYLGIHWRIDQDDGQEIGRRVGQYVFENFK